MRFKIKNVIILLLFSLFWFALLSLTGTFTSGFHFTDDHEILSISKAIDNHGFLQTLVKTINTDFEKRFRPFYFFFRVIETKFFGTQFFLWSIVNYLLAIITSFTLFLFARKLNYSIFFSVLFSFIVVLGSHSAIWWRLGPQEGLGLCLMATSLCLLGYSFERKITYLIISFVFLVLATLTKESFVIFIPAYALLIIYINLIYSPKVSIKVIIKRDLVIFLGLTFLFLTELFIIIWYVGTNKITYAGIDNGFNFVNFISQSYKFFIKYNAFWLILVGIYFIVQNYNFDNFSKRFSYSKNRQYLVFSLLIVLIILPQLVLYDKSGIFERYFVPFILGVALVTIYIGREIISKRNYNFVTKVSYTSLIVGYLIFITYKDVVPAAKKFTSEGRATHNLIKSLSEVSSNQDSTLIVLNGYINFEWGISLRKYLNIQNGQKEVYFFNHTSNFDNLYANQLQSQFTNFRFTKMTKSLEGNYKSIVVLPYSFSDSIVEVLQGNLKYRKKLIEPFIMFISKD